MTKSKIYVVWKGRKPGIYASWAECEAQVKGYPDAQFKAFPTREMAEAAFHGAYEEYKGKASSLQQWLFAATKPVLPSLCVDAACSGSPGPVEYRGVVTETGEQVFRQGPFAGGTNNVGEFLAIVHALGWLENQGRDWPIYTDSVTAMAWVKKGRCGTKLARNAGNAPLFELIARAESWLQEHVAASPVRGGAISILKWDTNAWGEIPADFGRK
ncbi:MAG: ribonuclease H [Chloroflexi bacterium]|nr:ribonuclease H [Chloroflexota bacterium]